MKLNFNNITFIIVCYKSEEVIFSCISSLPKESKKIIIENSNNITLKKKLELKYDNIEVLINKNLGMGASNNIGISKAKTDYVYILNPDTKFKNDTFHNLVQAANKLEDFAILSPLCSDRNFPNYKILKTKNNINNDIIEVDTIDGFSMLINKHKFNNKFFDENIFLYLENDDICFRARKQKDKIYVIKNSIIDHLGSSSTKIINDEEFEYLRNWHWMWSKFYFNKKHYGKINSFFIILPHLISAACKFMIYSILLKNHKKKIYKMRISGLINSMLGKKSFFRID